MNHTDFSEAEAIIIEASIRRLVRECLFDPTTITQDDVATELGCYAQKLRSQADTHTLSDFQRSALAAQVRQRTTVATKLRRLGITAQASPPSRSTPTTNATISVRHPA